MAPPNDKKTKKEKEEPAKTEQVNAPVQNTNTNGGNNGDKNFDFTLNNGNHLEEIREQLKEESNILDEWETK